MKCNHCQCKKNKTTKTMSFSFGNRKLFDWYKLNWWQKILVAPLVFLFFFVLIILLIIFSPIILIGLLFFKKESRVRKIVDGKEIYEVEVKIFGGLYRRWYKTEVKTKKIENHEE